MPKTDRGSLNCWRQTVRQRGSIQDGKTPCMAGGEEEGREGEDGGDASTKNGANDQECGGKRWTLALDLCVYSAWRGGAQILKKEEEYVRLVDRCEAKRNEWDMRTSHGKMRS